MFTYWAEIWPLNNPGHYLHWHWFSLSVGNFIVILTMVLTFVAALFAPFPGRGRRGGRS